VFTKYRIYVTYVDSMDKINMSIIFLNLLKLLLSYNISKHRYKTF